MAQSPAHEQLDRVARAGAADSFDLVVVCGLGLIGAFICHFVAPLARRLLCLDFDCVSLTTTVLAPYAPAQVGVPKARAMARFLAEHFKHLRQGQCVGCVLDVTRLGDGLWRAAARFGRVVVIVALDSPAAVAAVTRGARRAGLHCVVATVGPAGAEAIAFRSNGGGASWASLGLAGSPAQPCLEITEDRPRTISTPHVGSVAAALATNLAIRLVKGELDEPRDERMAFGSDGVHLAAARVEAPAHDEECAQAPVAAPPIVCDLTTEQTFREVAAWLDDPGAVLYPEAHLPVSCEMDEADVPLSQLETPLWPIIRCDVRGKARHLELRGDACDLGVDELLLEG